MNTGYLYIVVYMLRYASHLLQNHSHIQIKVLRPLQTPPFNTFSGNQHQKWQLENHLYIQLYLFYFLVLRFSIYSAIWIRCVGNTELYCIEVARFKILSLPWFDAYVNLYWYFYSLPRNLLLTFTKM